MHKAVFTIEDYAKAYIGYSPQIKWKLWEMAHFELAEAKRVAEGFNECAEHPMQYDPIYDQFFVWDEGNQDYDIIKGEDIQTEDGIKHLYAIGAGNWFWSAPNDKSRLDLAQQIEEFIFYHDTYKYMDEYDLKREVVVEAIKTRLKDLLIFQQIYEVWHEDLEADEKFEKLGGILHV